jgi:hypothetical protein
MLEVCSIPFDNIHYTKNILGIEGFFFTCCPSETEYKIDNIVDAIELNDQIVSLIKWLSSILPVHSFIGPLLHRIKDQISQIYSNDQFYT